MMSSLPAFASTSGRPSTCPISWTSTVSRSIRSATSASVLLNSAASPGVGSTNQPQPAAVRSSAMREPRASPSSAPDRSVSSIEIDSSLRSSSALSPVFRHTVRAASSADPTSPAFSGAVITITVAGASPSAARNAGVTRASAAFRIVATAITSAQATPGTRVGTREIVMVLLRQNRFVTAGTFQCMRPEARVFGAAASSRMPCLAGDRQLS